jgi:hypothetical protein
MRFWKFIGGVAVMFAGCSSFNRYTYITPQQQQQQAEQAQQQQQAQQEAKQIEQKATDIVLKNVCPKAAFKKLPKEPTIDRGRWASAPDDKALEGAMMDHIAAQQRYIASLKAQVIQERTDYSARCEQFAREQADRSNPSLPAPPQ